jgi:hypothetical protein
MKTLRINIFAVVVAVIAGQIVPMAWYSLFADEWMDLAGITLEQARELSPAAYVVSVISTAVMAYVMAWFFVKLRVESAVEGLKYGLIIGVAFNFMSIYTQNWFEFRSPYLSLIDGGNNVIVFTVTGLILGGWRRYVG